MIVHFDIDAFYASVAQRDDPSLRGRPVAIAWNTRRSVLLTASYEARPFGVRSAMPLYRALELCPELIVVPPDFTRYREASSAIFAIFANGAGAVEGLSLDEAYVALPVDEIEDAAAYARGVRETVRRDVGLTVSAGVARQKLLAKIASDDAKPDGLRTVLPGSEVAYLRQLPVGRLWGIGPKSELRLRAAGVTLVGELAELDDERLFALFGRSGRAIRELARGHDDRIVESDRATRSISSETTFDRDLRTIEELRPHLDELCADVARRLAAQGLRAQTIGIKLKHADFHVFGRQTTLAEPTDACDEIEAAAFFCLRRLGLRGEAIRLMGVRAATLDHEPVVQTSMFGEAHGP